MKTLYLAGSLAASLLFCSTPPAKAQVSSGPLEAALDGAGFTYTTDGWFVLTANTHDGVDAARSAQIGDYGSTFLETTVTGPDRIRFWWSVESEYGYDYLSLFVDGEYIQSISGAVAWQEVIYDIPEGSHTVRWQYQKDGSVSTQIDAGFLDEVRLASQINEPIITSPRTVIGTPNEFFSYQITGTLNPQTFTATPLPPWLTLSSSGLLSGYPTTEGVSEVNLSAIGPAGTATASLTISVMAPTITSPTDVTAVRGELLSYQISATHSVQTFAATPLPAWLTLNPGGLLSGFPAGSGTIEVNISATGPAGTATAILFITILEPVITSDLFASATRGELFSYQIAATGNPQSFAASPLPAWLTLTPSGLLSGFPAGSGTIEVNISATGPGGSATAILSITILEPVITSDLFASATRGELFSYQIAATGNPQSFAASPLPAWLTLTPSGLLSGFPTGSGTVEVNIFATGPGGTATAILSISIAEPFITSDLFASATRGELFSYQIAATGNPQSFAASPLPAWLTLTPSGLLSGFPTGSGTVEVNIFATGPGGTATAILSISIAEPFITSDLFASARRGELFSYQITATGNPQSFTATPLPAGLTLSSGGLLSGFLTGSGTINVNISATGPAGTAQATLAIYIEEPVITSPLLVMVPRDEPFTYQISSTGNPQTFTAAPLPAWLSLSATGLLSGFPVGSGTINMNISATGPAGRATAILVLTIPPSPATLAAAGDGMGLAWSHNEPTHAYWFNQSDVTHDGMDALQSGAIGHAQASYFKVEMTGPGTLSFWWRVSSESCCDPLRCWLNGVPVADIRGETGWLAQRLTIPEGFNTVVFSYSKDGSVATSADAGWIDEITFTPVDADNDGLSDSWEQSFFASLAPDPEADADSDGFSNLNEYRLGTAPDSFLSNPGFVLSSRNPDDSVTLEWPAAPGFVYGIEWSTNLINWTPLPDKVSTTRSLARAVVAPLETSVTLVSPSARAFALGPASDIGTTWRGGNEATFLAGGGHTGWLTGQQGAGYENDPQPSGNNIPYTPFIGLDIKSQTYNASPRRSSVYVRIPFTVENPAAFSSLRLRVRFDDGFASWINGRSLSNENAPVSPAWNATTSDHPDSLAVIYREYNVTSSLPLLVSGTNILAIQGVNREASSSDLLVQAVLTATIPVPPGISQRVYWRLTSE